MKKFSNRRGMTLVELLLAMGIISILMLIIMRVFVQIVEMKLAAEAESAVSQDARYIYARLMYDLNRADSIDYPTNPGESADSLILTIGGVTYTYQVDGAGNLTLDYGAGPVNLNSVGSRVSDVGVSFTHLGGADKAQSIQMVVPIESVTQRVQGPATATVETTGGTR